jgi:hypothetical protein
MRGCRRYPLDCVSAPEAWLEAWYCLLYADFIVSIISSLKWYALAMDLTQPPNQVSDAIFICTHIIQACSPELVNQ